MTDSTKTKTPEAESDARACSMAVKCLTIWEPYASLVMSGLKRFETRSWATTFRGVLVVHAAKKCDRERLDDVIAIKRLIETIPSSSFEPGGEFALTFEQKQLLERPFEEKIGCALGFVKLESCEPMMDGGGYLENSVGFFGEGRFGWKCTDHHVFSEPIPTTGKQGLWKPTEEIIKRIRIEFGVQVH